MSTLSWEDKLPFNLFSLVVAFILFSIFLYKWLVLFNTKKMKLPPTPPKLPIIGNLHQLGKFPHRSLRSLSQKYGDLMLLYLGNKPTLVVSSATAAEHIMKTHDLIFANRPKNHLINKILYEGNDVAFSSYGEKWRQMKSICVMNLLSNKRVRSFRTIREEQVALVIEEIRSYKGDGVINLSEMSLTFFRRLTCRAAFGRKFSNEGDGGADFYKLFRELLELLGEVCVGDYVPCLGWIDRFRGLDWRAEKVREHFDQFIEQVIHQHQISLTSKQDYDDEQDFVDVLLEIQRQDPQQLSTDNIKAIIMDMFVAGTESTSKTLEWAMTELIRHPNIMKKLQEEVRWNVKTDTSITEDELEKMEYLKAVIKETLRLHPPLPLLLFFESTKDVKINNYDIAARTQVIVNASAIHTDPKFWQDPEEFNPERFLGNSVPVDFRGHFQYIPFGAGRRGCPGIAYGIVNLELVLASLVNEFNWSLPNGKDGFTLDIEEGAGISIPRKNPLMIIATPTPTPTPIFQ